MRTWLLGLGVACANDLEGFRGSTQVEKREIGDDPSWGATLHGVVFNILVGSDGQGYQKHPCTDQFNLIGWMSGGLGTTRAVNARSLFRHRIFTGDDRPLVLDFHEPFVGLEQLRVLLVLAA